MQLNKKLITATLIPLMIQAAPLWGGGQANHKKEKKPSSAYFMIAPDLGLINIESFRFNTYTGAGAEIPAFIDHSNAMRFGLVEEFGAGKMFRFKVREHLSFANTTALVRTTQAILFDADAAVTFAIPIFRKSRILLNGGYEYSYARAKSKQKGIDKYFTPWILSLHGPFAGLGMGFEPKKRMRFECGAAYHMPKGTGHLRTADANGNSGPGAWLAKVHYNAARSGYSAYMNSSWEMSPHMAFTGSIEAKQLCAAGNSLGTPSATAVESEREVMNVVSVNYMLGFDFKF